MGGDTNTTKNSKNNLPSEEKFEDEPVVVDDNTNEISNEKKDMEDKSDVVIIKAFEDLNLSEQLLRGIYAYGFEKPSGIQQRGILPIISGVDVIAQAQSGTGKTGTFVIGGLYHVDPTLLACQLLILAPSRELALQIDKVVRHLGDHMSLKCHACIGGTDVKNDVNKLKTGVHVVVGTPGRVKDMMMARQCLDISSVRLFVLDEADEMLSRGFKSQIHDIFSLLPQDVQIALFSATMPADILDLTTKFMREPKRILVKNEELTLEGIKQYYVVAKTETQKYEILTDLYETIEIQACIIYVNSRKRADELAGRMSNDNHTVSCIHGEMPQVNRDSIMNAFRAGSSRVLITTDLLARGIDIQQVSLVVNYDLPTTVENYIHRIGRSGRFGKKGIAINFVLSSDIHQLKYIESYYNTQIEPLPVTSGNI